MSGSGKQLIGVWINREKWGLNTKTSVKVTLVLSYAYERLFKTTKASSCGLYHYKSSLGRLKSALIISVQRKLEDELSTLVLLLKVLTYFYILITSICYK